jgi:enoyl-CoA hydratase
MIKDVFIRCERYDNFALVIIDRQAQDNGLNQAVIRQLVRTFAELQDDAEVRAVILTGAGEQAFSAGADLEEISHLTPEQAAVYARAGGELAALIEGLGKPVIAAVNGLASGGGCELALLCAWRIASASATFALPDLKHGRDLKHGPDLKHGLIPGWGGGSRLSRLIGKSRALEMILTGEPVGAEESLRIGLVDRVVADGGELMAICEELARRIGRNAPLAVKYALAAVNRGSEVALSEGLRLESALFALCFATGDFREGVKAFLEKREPVFKGE